MTETKFTPGPWFVRTLENFGWNIVHHRNGDRHDILRVAKEANKTDAHLIAAAPDGYALAKLVMEICGNPKGISERDQEELYEVALQYTNKARGES